MVEAGWTAPSFIDTVFGAWYKYTLFHGLRVVHVKQSI